LAESGAPLEELNKDVSTHVASVHVHVYTVLVYMYMQVNIVKTLCCLGVVL